MTPKRLDALCARIERERPPGTWWREVEPRSKKMPCVYKILEYFDPIFDVERMVRVECHEADGRSYEVPWFVRDILNDTRDFECALTEMLGGNGDGEV